MMKKIGVLLPMLIIVFSIAGCGGAREESAETLTYFPDGYEILSSKSCSDEVPDELLGLWLSDGNVNDGFHLLSFYIGYEGEECGSMLLDSVDEEILETRYYDFWVCGNIITFMSRFSSIVPTYQFTIDGDSLILGERTYHREEDDFLSGK